MTKTASRGGCWPTNEQTLLLRASLLSGAPAIEAYDTWRARVAWDKLDRGSFRLLPLLAQNLGRHDVRGSLVERIESMQRETRSRNAVLMSRLRMLLTSFAQLGLDTIILKGSALLTLYYQDLGLRPMSDLDVLVRTEDVETAMALLRRSGWTSQIDTPECVVPVTHSLLFQDVEATRLDLHWHVLWESCGPGMDQEFWAGAVSTTIAGVPTAALCPADQLFHVCVHGVAWNPVPPLRWAADAVLVLRTASPGVAWERLLMQARRLRLVLVLRKALAFLQSALDIPVPEEVLTSLQAWPISMIERLEYRARLRPWGRLGALPRQVCHYVRLSRAAGQRPRLLGFPRYLQQLYGLARLRDLPPELRRRLRQRPDATSPRPTT